MLKFVFHFALLASAVPAAATFMVSEECQPASLPMCVDSLDTYQDVISFTICQQEVNHVLEEAKAYVDCLTGKAAEANRALDEAQQEWVCRSEFFGFKGAEVREFGKQEHPFRSRFVRDDIVCNEFRPVPN